MGTVTPRRTNLLLAILAALLAALAVAAPEFAIDRGRVLCAVVVVAALIGGARFRIADAYVLVFIIWYAVSTLWSDDQDGAFSSAKLATTAVAYYFAMKLTATDRRSILVIALGFLAGCVFAQVGLINDSGNSIPEVARIVLSLEFLDRETFERTLSGDVNYLAYSFVGGLALLPLVRRMLGKRPLRGVLTLAYFLTCAAGLALAGTRGATVGAVLLAVWMAAFWVNRYVAVLYLGAVAVIVQAHIIFGFEGGLLGYFQGGASDLLSGRPAIWAVARAMWADAPIIGEGAGAFSRMYGIAGHNVMMNLGPGIGLVGLILYFVAVSAALKPDSDLGLFVAGGMLAANLPALLTGVWELAIPAWVLIGIVSASIPVLRDAQAEDDRRTTELPSGAQWARPSR